MWSIENLNSNVISNAVTQCRRKMHIYTYRTRNPIETVDIFYPFSFLYVPGGRTNDERDRYCVLKTISTPRNVDVNEGVNLLIGELANLPYNLNFIVVNTINSKEVGDAFSEHLITEGANLLRDYTMPMTQSAYHRTHMLYAEKTVDDVVKKYYYLFTNKMNDLTIGRMAACVCAHMNLFGESNRAIANALLQGKQAEYEEVITAFASAIVDEAFKKEMQETLTRAGSYGATRLVNRLERDIQRVQQQVDEYMRHLRNRYDEMSTLRMRLLGAQHMSESENELSQFLNANIDNITYAKLDGGYLYLRYRTPLLYWDEDIFKILRESSNGNPMRQQSPAKQNLIDSIFSTRTVRLWIDTGVKYNLTGNGFSHMYMNNEFYEVPEVQGLPNPHHYYYNCWGDNEPMIAAAQGRGDNVVALAQIFAAMAGINLSDNTVLRRFVDSELEDFNNIACLEIVETGEVLTIQQYYDRYEEQTL